MTRQSFNANLGKLIDVIVLFYLRSINVMAEQQHGLLQKLSIYVPGQLHIISGLL